MPVLVSQCSTASCGSNLKARLRHKKCAGRGSLGTGLKNRTTTGRIHWHVRRQWLVRPDKLGIIIIKP